MSTPLIAVVVGVSWTVILIFALGLCCAAADGDRIAELLARDKWES